ncbi:MAG TPA: hypothetical protein VK738_20585 [Terriglobales bacterium]|nr:hypothetical protein [Terriglobales bacterium]
MGTEKFLATSLDKQHGLRNTRLRGAAMFESFDEFAEQKSQEVEGRKVIERETKPEWAMLKGLTESLALDGKGIDPHKFEWASGGAPRLILDHVAASFLHRERNGLPQDCRVRFDRRPPGLGKMYLEEESPLTPVVWDLKPVAVDEHVCWFIAELGDAPLSSSELADQIAVQLAKFHLAYKRHYEHWSPGETG